MRSIFERLGLDRLGRHTEAEDATDPAAADAPLLGFWQRLLGGAAADRRETESVRRIVSRLQDMPERAAQFVGAFAYVLTRVARADLEFSPAELEAMRHALVETVDVAPEMASLVVELARVQANHQAGTDDYLVTRQFRELSERPDRLRLIRALFAVAAADGSISQVEDQTISQIAIELGLTASEVAGCRGEFREYLAVLQNLPTRDTPG